MDERELVGLLYRADWTRLSLTGTVRGSGQFPATWAGERWWSASFGEGLRLGSFSLPDPPPDPPDWMTATADRSETESTLTLAPGKRYRLATEDGSRVLGCDGERVWQWLADVPPGERVTFERRLQPPVAGLLAPAWLLLGYRLSVEGETTVAGRTGIVVTGVARTAPLRGLLGSTVLGWGLVPRPERVSAVIDAELGIVLRRELWDQDGTVEVTEFLGLEVGGAVDPSVFSPAAGSFFGDGSTGEGGSERPPLEEAGREALKMVAGLAAGGLGAAIKCTPKRHVDPFAAATAEDPDDAMPDDEPLPAWAGGQAAGGAAEEASEADGRTPVSDEVLNLLYRAGLEPAPFSGRLCDWTDGEVVGGAVLGGVPESARRAGFGGVGFLVDTILTLEDSPGRFMHAVYSVRVGGWDRFRVDRVFRAPPARARKLPVGKRHRDELTVACDGQRTFRVFEDEVRVGPASALDEGPHGDLAQLVDGSWLLGCRLSGGEAVDVDGRTGYRVIATAGEGPTLGAPLSWLPGWWLPAVAVVDASSGRLLRLTRYRDGRAATRLELRSLSDGGSDDFEFTPPDGLPVVEERERDWSRGSDDDDDDDDLKFFGPDGRRSSPPEEVRAVVDAVKKQVDETVTAARGFLGSFLGGRRLVGLGRA
jgi:outer membrane lipoprotein-sorting protein